MGDRTPDLMTASHALSQLSYGPTRGHNMTKPVSGVKSNFIGDDDSQRVGTPRAAGMVTRP